MVVLPFEKRMLPVRKSMTFMKKSDPHETTRLASGENLTPLTCLLCDGSSRIIDAVFRHQRNTVKKILGLVDCNKGIKKQVQVSWDTISWSIYYLKAFMCLLQWGQLLLAKET